MARQTVTTSIIDPATGKPATYDRDILTTEISAPSMSGVRSIMAAHPAQGLDPSRLASILRQAETGDAQAQWELAEDIEELYLHYQGQLGTRKRAVSQLETSVVAGTDDKDDQRNADFIREWLERDTLEDELFDILDAAGKGVSFTETIWEMSSKLWIPERLETRFGQWFQFDLYDGKTPRLIGGPDGNAGLPTDLPPFKFIVHQHPAKTGLPLRGGLIRGVAWAYLFQAMTWRDWVIFAEVYGMPIRVGKYGPESTADERRTLLRAVAGISTDAAAIIPQSMEIDFQNAVSGASADVFERLVTKLDDQVSKAVLGQTGTADAKAQGIGSGSANVHNDVREDIQRADAKKLRATLNRQLIRPMIDLNFGPPTSGRYPKINIGQAELFTKDDMSQVQTFVAMGGRVEESVIRDKLGLPDPPEAGTDGQPVRLLTAPVSAAPAIAPKTPSVAANDPAAASSDAQVAASASESLLRPLKRALNADPSPTGAPDAIDAAISGMDDQWTEVMAPLAGFLEETLSAATSYDDLRMRLKALADAPVDKLTELLERSTFGARLAGLSGQPIDGGGS